ncbi:protein-(glutamine-N5) methyltransferase, release factor-specific [Idiomarina piscisalsi]|uniref:Release factor glutamine methyltransferase n=1 Tax=Idiomarina piscisalsi TaxID=1096243 RepID=A0ABN5AUW3_9GAMM|nr:peptide chain release factor N(5)-glutamine methyltransferase [Idiomarina piscisalsi]ASG66087.1 protein-(glutamine-N5) methyltransferase, release factor-specific [Idiomarina piscisalsi]
MTIEEAQQWARQQLAHIDDVRADVFALLGFVLDKNKTYLMTWPERALTDEQLERFEVVVHERVNGKPIAYITGRKEFWSLELETNESTLIPRGDTETLVETALSLDLPDNARVLDLGTGTGAIALALKSERPNWQVCGCDKNGAAVALAVRNAIRNDLDVEFFQSDWFSHVSVGKPFDLIVSNPPYIEEADPHLRQGDVRFEPLSALVATGDGLDDIKNIIIRAKSYLADGGWLLLEQGWQQADSVIELLTKSGYKKVNRWQDYASVERVSGGQYVTAERDK